MNLTAASAIVTGGAGGLGAATVRHLVALGVGVVIVDLDGERAASLAAELGPTTTAVRGDVTADADVASAIDAARALGTLSIVANVAGGGTRPARTVDRDGTPHDLGTF